MVKICLFVGITLFILKRHPGWFVTFVHSFDIKVHFTWFKTSQKTNVVVEQPFGAQERSAFDHLFGGPVPIGTEKAEGSVHCPRAPTQEPSKGLRPHNRHSQKRKVKRSWCPVSCLSWLARLGFLSRASVSGSLFPVFPARHVPAPGWEGRRVKRTGTDPRTGGGADPRTGFFRYPSTYALILYLDAPVLFFVFLFATLFLRITTGSRSIPATHDWTFFTSRSAVRAQTLQNGKVPVFRLLPLRVHVSSSCISLQEGTCSWETFADFPGDDFWSCFRIPGSTADTRAHTSVHGCSEKITFFYVKMHLRSRGRHSSLRLLVLVRLRSTGSRFFSKK